MINPIVKTIELPDGRTITLETGKLAKQADGSVMLRMGNTMLLATVCAAKDAVPGTDFMPLQVEYKEKFLLRNGADKVVYPEKQVARWASIRYTDDHILDYMEVDASHAIFEVEVPEEWVGKTVGELDIRKRYNINILAVKNEGEFGIAISPDTYFEENHKLLVLGEYRALQKCFRI